jgi:GTP-binding protein EngB required for normal cell division
MTDAASADAASVMEASALEKALDELAAPGTDRDRQQISALRDRLDAARLRVLVAGEAKRGKSTLINALLGRAVLPAGVTPLTAVATTVRYGDDPHAQVRFADGHEEKQPLSALPDLVTERGNPGNQRLIASVTVYLDAPLLADGVELVDTPGTGSVFAWDTVAAHEALEAMDAAVFVLTADPPVSAAERDLYAKVADLSVVTFTVLNKADHLDAAGLAEAADFTGRVLAEASAGPGSPAGQGTPLRVYPLSARAALDGGDPGFGIFAADFKAYLARKRVSDLRTSAAAQARRIAGSLLDEVALTRRAAQLATGDAADRVQRFGERLAEVTVRGRDAVAVVNAESARLLMALNDAADADGPRLGDEVARRLAEVLDGELRTAGPAVIEDQGRERLVAFTLAAASAWRARWRQAIEDGLARTNARLTADLTAALEVLRDSAAELLGLELAVPDPGGRLAEDRRFFYTTHEEAGQTELLAGAIRRRLPGELGRRRAREHLRREAPELVRSQVGRARGDLQYRLSEASRALARSVERRYAEATDRMRAALRAADDLRGASAAEAAGKERELSRREAAVRHALAVLDETSSGQSAPRRPVTP